MILMSLLLVLSIERLVNKQPNWHVEKYAEQYREWIAGRGWLTNNSSTFALYVSLFLPALLLGVMEYWLLGTFLTFIEQSFVLFICIGCPALRATYKCFLNAAHRGE